MEPSGYGLRRQSTYAYRTLPWHLIQRGLSPPALFSPLTWLKAFYEVFHVRGWPGHVKMTRSSALVGRVSSESGPRVSGCETILPTSGS